MKRVLFISNSYYDFKNQARVLHLKEKFEGLSRGGVKCYVLAKGRPYHKKVWGADFYLLSNKFFFEMLAFRIGFCLCLSKKIDVIIAQSPLLEGFLGAWLKGFFRKKQLIVEAHGDWDSIFLVRKRHFVSLQKRIVRFLVKASFKKADKVRVVADYLLEKTKALAPHKPHFIFPTFTDLDSFLREKNSQLGSYILFVGGLYKIKGVECLIKALPRAALGKFTDGCPRLIIIGDGPERKWLEQAVQEYGLDKKVEFKGSLSLQETRQIMKNCYCLALPSLSEGLPRVILEAMALAKPVIASRVGGIPDIVKDGQNGFLFEPGNAAQLAQKINQLLHNRKLAEQIGQKARAMVEQNFSNQKYIDSYLQMINQSI